MKIYLFFFVIITLAEFVFTLTYFLMTRKPGTIILLGLFIYIGVMIIGFIAYRVEKYRRRRSEILKNLP